MNNGEKALFLIEAEQRLNNALANFDCIDKDPARIALEEAIRTVLSGTCAEKFTEELISRLTRHCVPLCSNDFATFTDLVSASSDKDLSNVYMHYQTEEFVKF
jgi:hypothetical protein